VKGELINMTQAWDKEIHHFYSLIMSSTFFEEVILMPGIFCGVKFQVHVFFGVCNIKHG